MSLCQDAQFYDVSDDNIKLTEGIILTELNAHKDKYKVGDILFLGDNGSSPFAIVDDTINNTLTYRLDDHATNLPIQILKNLTAHKVKYKQLLQGNNGKKVFRDLFIVDEGYLPDIVAEYTRLGIY